MKLLIVEDQAKTGQYLRQGLAEAGFTTEWVADGASGQHLALTGDYDLLILDVMLPGRDGWQILQAVRGAGLDIPVLFLTARDAVEDRVHGLELGADDYLVKPFDVEELKARVRALLRRSQGRAQPMLEHAGIHLDPATQQVRYLDEDIIVTPMEYQLLHQLMVRPGKVVTRERLSRALYGWQDRVESNTLEVLIHNLRKKLSIELIRTVRGVGYVLVLKP